MSEERIFPVKVLSPGIAIGKGFFCDRTSKEVPEFSISSRAVGLEISRYRKALSSSQCDLEKLHEECLLEGSSEAATILDSHIQMLKDPMMTTKVEEKVRQRRKNIESVFRSVIQDYEKAFTQRTDTYFQERLVDVKDLSNRILEHLSPEERWKERVSKGSILFSHEFFPSDVSLVHRGEIPALVAENGGEHSHLAMIARSEALPYVCSFSPHLLAECHGKTVIIDAISGKVILDPSRTTLEEYLEKKERYDREVAEQGAAPPSLQEGSQIEFYLNAGFLTELEEIGSWHGIGLFRSELNFLDAKKFPSDEEEQTRLFSSIVQKGANKPVVIRLFDFGGDKSPPFYQKEFTHSPCAHPPRGVAYLLTHPKELLIHILALLRASVHGDLRILIPFVSRREEVQQIKAILQKAIEILRERGLFLSPPLLGVMVELPAAVMILSELAEEVDFFSVGTNDLHAYTYGADRTRGESHIDLAFIRLLALIVKGAQEKSRPLTICGEMAADPTLFPLLRELGFTRFSLSREKGALLASLLQA